MCKIQPQAAFAIKRPGFNPATFPYPRPHPFPGQIQSIAACISSKTPNCATCPATNLLGSTSIYTPWTSPSFLRSYLSILNPPLFLILFSPSSQSCKQHRQDVWSSSRLHRLCRQNPRWFFLGVRNCCSSLAAYDLMLKSQSSSLSGLTATQLGSAAIKGLSTLTLASACV